MSGVTDPIAWLDVNSFKLALLAICALLFYWVAVKWPSPSKMMHNTFLRTQLYFKVERGTFSRKVLPKLIEDVRHEEWGYIFRYRLPPGMSLQQFIDKKSFIDIAFGGEATLSLKGNVLKIEVMNKILPDKALFQMDAVKAVVRNENIPLVLGCSKKGIKVLDLAEAPHALVIGESGLGKSVFIRQLLTALVTLRSDKEIHLTLFDLKNGLELSMFKHLPHIQCFVKDNNGLESTLLFVRDVMNERGELLEQSEAADLHDYNRKHPEQPLPHHVVIIDEVAEIADTKIIERVIRRGRAYGVHLILVTQKPELVKSSFPLVIRFKRKNGVNKLPVIFGRAKVEFNGECEMQGLYLSQEAGARIVNELKQGAGQENTDENLT